MRLWPVATVMLAACAPAFTKPPANAPVAEETGRRTFLSETGTFREEDDPYATRAVRQADYDTFVTRISDRVALVVQPQTDVPAGVSNLLASALVRRFQGELPEVEALTAPRVFFIQPYVSAKTTRQTGEMVVDWRLSTADRHDVGVVFATRRLSGVMRGNDPLTAFSVADAEHIAFQTAAHLMDTEIIRTAMQNAEMLALIDDTPTPAPRPEWPGVAKPVAAPEAEPQPGD